MGEEGNQYCTYTHDMGRVRRMRSRLGWFFLLWIGSMLLGLLAQPAGTSAHAVMTESVPGPGSRLDAPPPLVALSFQEAIEPSAYALRVLNADGKPVSGQHQAALSADRRTLSLSLPPLADGVYTVTYKVISADGHPVGGSYVFAVGAEAAAGSSGLRPAQPQGPASASERPLAAAVRVLYFFSLLALAGRIFWQSGEAFPKRLYLLFLFALAANGVWQLSNAVSDWSVQAAAAFLTRSGSGILWGLALVLALTGPPLWRIKAPLSGRLWAFVMLAVNGFSGHAAAFGPSWVSVPLMIVHLLAGAVWTGGLLCLVVRQRRGSSDTRDFLRRFSRAALLSILALAVSGATAALLFLPNPLYVFYGTWGRLLLLKAGIVLLVAVTATLIRGRIRQDASRPIGRLLAADFSLMLAVVIVSGIFTGFSPLPANKPLQWEETGGPLQAAVDIMPNAPGRNHFHVSVTLPAKLSPPKRVELLLRSTDKPDMYPLEVPLNALAADPSAGVPSGLARFEFMAEGDYLPFPGRWLVELRTTDRNDDETVLHREMRIF